MKKWKERSTKEKSKLILTILLWLIAATLVVLYFTVFSSESGGYDSILVWIDNQAPVVFKSIIYIIIAIGISMIIRFALSKLLLLGKRGKTTVNLIDSFVKYFTAIIIIIMVLIIFGVDPLALFASIGILGLIVGLSAQSLISDIISGLFIVFEGEYEIGDYI